jgi:hypothetical protein
MADTSSDTRSDIGELRVGVSAWGSARATCSRGGRSGVRRPRSSPNSTTPSGPRARPTGASPASPRSTTCLDPTSPHQVDVIDLCTPPSMHEEQIVRCLDAGVHVICEKPLVDSVVACDRSRLPSTGRPDVRCPVHADLPVPLRRRCRPGPGADRRRHHRPPVHGIVVHVVAPRARLLHAAPWRGTWDGERGGCVLSHAIHNHDLLTWMAGPLSRGAGMVDTRVNDVETEDCAVAIGRTADGGLVTMNVTLGAASESSQLVWHFDNVTITSSTEAYDPAPGPWNFEFRRSPSPRTPSRCGRSSLRRARSTPASSRLRRRARRRRADPGDARRRPAHRSNW